MHHAAQYCDPMSTANGSGQPLDRNCTGCPEISCGSAVTGWLDDCTKAATNVLAGMYDMYVDPCKRMSRGSTEPMRQTSSGNTATSSTHGKRKSGLALFWAGMIQLAGHLKSNCFGPRSFQADETLRMLFEDVNVMIVLVAKFSLPLIGSVRAPTTIFATVCPCSARMFTTPPCGHDDKFCGGHVSRPNSENDGGNETLEPAPGSTPPAQLLASNLGCKLKWNVCGG